MMTAVLNNDMDELSHRNLQSRNNFLFAAGTASVIAGLVFPDSIRLFELTLIFTLCLTGSVLAIAFCSKKTSDLSGFPSLVLLTICTQITSAVASTKLLASEETISLIISFFAKFVLITLEQSKGWGVILFLLTAIALLVISCKTAKKVLLKSKDFFETIASAKLAQNNSLVPQAADIQQNRNFDSKLNFLLAVSAAAKFAFCCSFILFIISLANLFAWAISLKSAGSNEITAQTLCGSIGFQLLALLTITGVFSLLGKTGSAAIEETIITEEQYKQRIKVVAREIASSDYQDIEETAFSGPDITQEKTNDNEVLWSSNQIDNEGGYINIAELIENSGSKTLMLAAASTEQLPVTIAVNVSIHLAQSSKILLVDCDLERKAVMQVFDIKSDAAKPIQSCVKNLWVSLPQYVKNNELINGFDYIIFYVPKIRGLIKAKHLIRSSQAAMLFGRNGEHEHADMKQLRKVLGDLSCTLLQPYEVCETV